MERPEVSLAAVASSCRGAKQPPGHQTHAPGRGHNSSTIKQGDRDRISKQKHSNESWNIKDDWGYGSWGMDRNAQWGMDRGMDRGVWIACGPGPLIHTLYFDLQPYIYILYYIIYIYYIILYIYYIILYIYYIYPTIYIYPTQISNS